MFPIVLGDHPNPLGRLLLFHNLRGEFGVAEQVIAKKLRVERHRERIVDLERSDMLNTALSKPVESTRSHQCREQAAVAVWGNGHVVRAIEQELEREAAEGRQVGLLEDQHVFGRKPEEVMLSQVATRGGIRGRTRHDGQRERAARPGGNLSYASEQEFEQAAVRDRAHTVDPLGTVAPQPRGLSAGDENRSSSPCCQEGGATGCGIGRGKRAGRAWAPVAEAWASRGLGGFQPGGIDGVGHRIGRLGEKTHRCDLLPVDLLQLRHQLFAIPCCQLVAVLNETLLAQLGELVAELFGKSGGSGHGVGLVRCTVDVVGLALRC